MITDLNFRGLKDFDAFPDDRKDQKVRTKKQRYVPKHVQGIDTGAAGRRRTKGAMQ